MKYINAVGLGFCVALGNGTLLVACGDDGTNNASSGAGGTTSSGTGGTAVGGSATSGSGTGAGASTSTITVSTGGTGTTGSTGSGGTAGAAASSGGGGGAPNTVGGAGGTANEAGGAAGAPDEAGGAAGAPDEAGGAAGAPDEAGGASGASNEGGAAGEGGGGAAGEGGSGAVTSATGVEVLSVPLANVGDGQRYNWENTGTSNPYDLTGATVNILAYAPGAVGGNFHVFFTSTNGFNSSAVDVALSTITGGFSNVAIPVPAAVPGGFDPANVFVSRIEIEAGASFGSSWQSPATVVYVDSITVSNSAFTDTFDASPSFSVFASSGARPLAGSSLTWQAAYP